MSSGTTVLKRCKLPRGKWFKGLRFSSLPDCVRQAARNLRSLATSRRSKSSVRPRGIRLASLWTAAWDGRPAVG